MVCTRSSSTKSDEAGAPEAVPPVQTRGRASTARRPAATTRRTRRASATDIKSSDAQDLESSELGSRASSEPDPQHESVASPPPVPSTPSRRGRKKQTSDTESCASLSDSVFQDTNVSQESLTADATKAGSVSSDSAVDSQAPVGVSATPSRRRRTSSSSSQTPQPSSPARITRAMRKAGISTPKDVIELEVVPEEQINVGDEAATFEDKEKREETQNMNEDVTALGKNLDFKDESGLASPEEVKKSLSAVIAALEVAPLQEESFEKTAKQSSPDITVLGDDLIESPSKIAPTGKTVKESSPDITVLGDDFIETPPKNASEIVLTPAPTVTSSSEQAEAESSSMSPKKSPRRASLSKTTAAESSRIQEGSEASAKEITKGVKSPIVDLTSDESKRKSRASSVSENPLRSPTLKRISFAESVPSPVRDTVTRVVDSVDLIESLVSEVSSSKSKSASLPARKLPTKSSPKPIAEPEVSVIADDVASPVKALPERIQSPIKESVKSPLASPERISRKLIAEPEVSVTSADDVAGSAKALPKRIQSPTKESVKSPLTSLERKSRKLIAEPEVSVTSADDVAGSAKALPKRIQSPTKESVKSPLASPERKSRKLIAEPEVSVTDDGDDVASSGKALPKRIQSPIKESVKSPLASPERKSRKLIAEPEVLRKDEDGVASLVKDLPKKPESPEKKQAESPVISPERKAKVSETLSASKPESSEVQHVGDSPRKSPKRTPLSNKLELLEVQQVAVSPKKSPKASLIDGTPPGEVHDAQIDESPKKGEEQPMDVAAPSPTVSAPEAAAVTQNIEATDASSVLTGKHKKKSKKASKKIASASGSIVEHAPEPVLVAEDIESAVPGDLTTEKRKKKTKKVSKKHLVTEAVEDEEEHTTAQDDNKYVELKSFKQCFKRPKFYGKAFRKAIPVLFEYASSLEPRKNDLPPELLKNCDQETMWQFISHRCKQISKEFRKRSALLELGLELKKEEMSSEDDMDDDEEDLEVEHEEDEEENADLLNLKDEDLKDLERELAEMRDDENQDENSKEPAARKKYPHSVVDDKFFSLAEMNAFLDEQDRAEGLASNILDSVDDSSTAAADYHYEEFFGKADGVGETAKSEKKKEKKRVRSKESDKKGKKKSVRFVVNEEQPEEEEEDNVENENEHINDGKVLLGDTEEPKQETSNLKKSLKRLKETIKKLEEENLAPKSWEMSGEVTAQQREENELLETHLEFDLGMKKAPEITEVFTEKLEEMIKQRIKDKAFDDVVRKKRIEERTESYRNQAIEEREMVKTSLAEVYEKEYQKVAGEHTDSNGVNEEHAAIEKRMRELFRLIDALSNFDYTPPEVHPEVRVVSNMPALQVEEVGMNASTDAQLLAPEEVKKHQKGTIKADEERDRTDKLRQRRKKKNRQRAMVELFGEEKAMEGLKKKKKRKDADTTDTQSGEKLKSTTFFTKLQQTVRDEIKEKTTKKKKMKVKSQEVSSGGSKYKL